MDQQPKKNWWGRNWKWCVPVGCLGALLLFAGLIALLVFFVFSLIKSSDAYQAAVAKAKAHPAVVSTLGTPIEEGMFASGSIHISGPSGDADLAIPLSGPQGQGTLYVVSKKSAGQWTFTTLVFEVEPTGQRIDLLE